MQFAGKIMDIITDIAGNPRTADHASIIDTITNSHSACAPVRVTNRSHSTYGSKLKFSLSEYFNFLFAYLVITYYSLQFVSNGDTK